jgi:hypothetical protein
VITDKMPFEFLDLDIALDRLNSVVARHREAIPYNDVFIVTRIRRKRILLGMTTGSFKRIGSGAD